MTTIHYHTPPPLFFASYQLPSSLNLMQKNKNKAVAVVIAV
jgi:hypothetical protein